MDEKDLETQIIEQLKIKNDNAANLITKLTAKNEEFTSLLNDLNEKKQTIESFINDATLEKQNFVSDINQKIDEFNNVLTTKTNEAENLISQLTTKSTNLSETFEQLTTKYTANTDVKIEEINGKIATVTDILNKEQADFDEFIKNGKTDYTQKATDFSNLIVQYNNQALESSSKIKANLDEALIYSAKIMQIQADIKVFKENIDDYVEKMELTTTNIESKTKEFEGKTKEIIETNQRLTKEIKEQLELATGESLFHTFSQRKKDLETSQTHWLLGLLLSILLFILFSIWLINELSHLDLKNVNWFFDVILKFSASAPLVYLIAFLTDRYTKERRLLEEYAFKSTISLALKPYFDLVSELQVDSREKDFLIKSIENIFATPTDKVFRTKECQNKIDISHITDMVKENLEKS